MHFTEPEYLEKLQTRWDQTKEHYLDLLDKPIVPLLLKLEQLPGTVVPVWSCSSHPERDPQSKRLYVSMAVDIRGLRSIVALTKRPGLRLEITNLLVAGIDHSLDLNSAATWTGVSMSHQFKQNVLIPVFTESSVKNFITELITACDDLIREHDL